MGVNFDGFFILDRHGVSTEVASGELNELERDIRSALDENHGDLKNAFLSHEFQKQYWRYLHLSCASQGQQGRLSFFRSGSLFMAICMVIEYLDVVSGRSKIFGDVDIKDIIASVETFEPINSNEQRVKSTLLLGLRIADSMKIYNPTRSVEDDYHPDFENFFREVDWVDSYFIPETFAL